MKAVIYARFSSEKQNEQSIEGQVRDCTDYAAKNNIEIVGSYIDRAISGTTDNRRDFQKMIADSSSKAFDAVIVWKMDRFARNRYDSAIYKQKLRKNGVKLLYAKENIPDGPEGIILESLLEGMAEYYSAELSQKLKRGIRESALKGKFTGGKPTFGYLVDEQGYYIPDPKTAPIVQEMYQRYIKGESEAQIMRSLNARGTRTVTGKTFSQSAVHRILTNTKYIGTLTVGEIVKEDVLPRLVSDELFESVKKCRMERVNRPVHYNSKAEYPLSIKAFCGICGQSIHGVSANRKGTIHYYYRCSGRKKKACDLQIFRKDDLENAVVSSTLDRLLNPETLDYIAERCAEESRKDSENNTRAKQLEFELKKKKEAIENILNAIERGIFTSSTKERLELLEQEKTKIEIELCQAQRGSPALTALQIKFMLTQMKKCLESEDVKIKNLAINTFIHKVFLYRDRIIIAYDIIKNSPESDNSELFIHGDNGLSTNPCGCPVEPADKQIIWNQGILYLIAMISQCIQN